LVSSDGFFAGWLSGLLNNNLLENSLPGLSDLLGLVDLPSLSVSSSCNDNLLLVNRCWLDLSLLFILLVSLVASSDVLITSFDNSDCDDLVSQVLFHSWGSGFATNYLSVLVDLLDVLSDDILLWSSDNLSSYHNSSAALSSDDDNLSVGDDGVVVPVDGLLISLSVCWSWLL